MDVIYEPKGPAEEYAHLAVNLYKGCRFACPYCYAPAIARMNLAEWSADPQPKKDILKRLEKDAEKMQDDPRTILLCFTCDPYQSEEAAWITRQALLILEKYKMTVTVLTKAGMAARQDFDILKRNDWQFGTTISHTSKSLGDQWESGAPFWGDRVEAVKRAHDFGIKTWVSVEPVMDTKEALGLIGYLSRDVDFWKIGKMNHRNLDIDWPKFREDAIALLDSIGAKYYIKKELREAK